MKVSITGYMKSLWIYEKSEKYKKLHKHLRTHRNKRKGHGKRKSKKVLIPQRISIHERSEIVDEKDRFGDWETDTVEFTRKKKNPYLSVQYGTVAQPSVKYPFFKHFVPSFVPRLVG
jgi:IS30 family transposase